MMLSKRGITPVISIILLLMLTISLTGAAWVWMKGTFEGMLATGGKTSVQLTITGCDWDGHPYIQNIGGATAYNVTVEFRCDDCNCNGTTWNTTSLEPGQKPQKINETCSCKSANTCIVRWFITSKEGQWGPGTVTCYK